MPDRWSISPLRSWSSACPELKNLDFAQTQEPLDPNLKKVGENTEAFFENYPNTSALEDVYFEREEPGRRDQYHKLKFYYIITAHNSEDELGLEEYRTTLKDERINLSDLKGAYLLTSGHASASLHFHPRLSAGCRFRYLGREKKNPQAHVIAFSQNPEKTRTWGMINMLGNEAAILTGRRVGGSRQLPDPADAVGPAWVQVRRRVGAAHGHHRFQRVSL